MTESEGPYQTTLTGERIPTTLVNVSEYGREGVTMVDRSTQFGNPFRMKGDGGTFSREECVEAYRSWFKDKIRTDPVYREAVEALRGKTLGCWCTPKPCHGDVILSYLQGEMDV